MCLGNRDGRRALCWGWGREGGQLALCLGSRGECCRGNRVVRRALCWGSRCMRVALP